MHRIVIDLIFILKINRRNLLEILKILLVKKWLLFLSNILEDRISPRKYYQILIIILINHETKKIPRMNNSSSIKIINLVSNSC